jgi:hypothetical protein
MRCDGATMQPDPMDETVVTTARLTKGYGDRLAGPPRARLSRRARKVWLTAHIVTSVGWLGGAYTMLVLGVAALRSDRADYRLTVYELMHLFDHAVNIPLALGMLTTGLVVALGGKWGLFRHWWVTFKLLLSLAVPVTTVWLSVPRVEFMQAALTTGASTGTTAQQIVVISAISTFTLTAVTAISVFKPWGRTHRPHPNTLNLARWSGSVVGWLGLGSRWCRTTTVGWRIGSVWGCWRRRSRGSWSRR